MTLGDLLDFVLNQVVKNPSSMDAEVKIEIQVLNTECTKEFIWHEPIVKNITSSDGKEIILISRKD